MKHLNKLDALIGTKQLKNMEIPKHFISLRACLNVIKVKPKILFMV